MTDFLPGDEIQVIYRGVVRQSPDVDYVTLDLTPSGYIDLFISAAKAINVVQRRSPAVGDSLLASEIQTAAFQPGSVVRYVGSNYAWLRTTTGWYPSDPAAGASPELITGATFTVVYNG